MLSVVGLCLDSLTAGAELVKRDRCAESPFRHAARSLRRLRRTVERCTSGRTGQIGEPKSFTRKLSFCSKLALPSEWIEICRVRCVLRTGLRPRTADTDSIGCLTNHLATVHVDPIPFKLASTATNVGIAAGFVSALVFCHLGVGQGT